MRLLIIYSFQNVVSKTTQKDFKRNAHSTATLLRELEISLRTNHVGWVKEFLNEHHGLDVLVDFLKFACWGLVASTINVKVKHETTIYFTGNVSLRPMKGGQ